jgi:hypothetical protein
LDHKGGDFWIKDLFDSSKAYQNNNLEIQWQMDSIDEQKFILLPSEFVVLALIQKGNQTNFYA